MTFEFYDLADAFGGPLPFIPLGVSVPADVRARVAPLRAVHSSFVVSSRNILRDLEYYGPYVARLSRASREALDTTPTGIWISVELARAHLEACGALGLPEQVELEIGRRLAARLHGPVLRIALRLAGVGGATPMLLAAKAVKLWQQRNDGGDLLIVQTARREARIELLGYSLADIAFLRMLWRGNLEANARLVMQNARVSELTRACSPMSIVYAMSW